MAATPPICDFGWKAQPFDLKNVDGTNVSLADIQGQNGTLIMFICNHCPYVKAIVPKMIRDAIDLAKLGVGVVAINANDSVQYPDDSFENMQRMSQENQFPFPYLHDEKQKVARAYNAICTPDFFGFNANLELQYRGRLDSARAQFSTDDLPRDLFNAMKMIVETGAGPAEQFSSMGCSIKWK